MLRTLARSHAKASLPLSQTCQVLKTWQVFYRWNFKDLRGFQNLGGLILRLNLMAVTLERGNEKNQNRWLTIPKHFKNFAQSDAWDDFFTTTCSHFYMI